MTCVEKQSKSGKKLNHEMWSNYICKKIKINKNVGLSQTKIYNI